MSGKKRKIEIRSEEDLKMARRDEQDEASPPAEEASDGAAETAPAQGEEPKPLPRDADFSKLEEEQPGAGAALKKELEEYKDKYLRALAELENFKKRALKERSELLKYQGERILFDMIEILDDFDRALQHAAGDPAQLRSGIEMIHRMFEDALRKWEVRGEPAIGKPFDPVKHHALSKVPVDDAVPGTVINELKKTYFYKDKLLRAGEVVVADQPVRAQDEGSALDELSMRAPGGGGESGDSGKGAENTDDNGDEEPENGSE